MKTENLWMNSNTAGPIDRAAPRMSSRRLTLDIVINIEEGVRDTRGTAGAPSPFSRSGRPCYWLRGQLKSCSPTFGHSADRSSLWGWWGRGKLPGVKLLEWWMMYIWMLLFVTCVYARVHEKVSGSGVGRKRRRGNNIFCENQGWP